MSKKTEAAPAIPKASSLPILDGSRIKPNFRRIAPDGTEKALRFGCGALFGVIIAAWLLLRHLVSGDAPLGWMTVAFGAVICGLLALRFGDRFWYAWRESRWLAPWWWWWS
jgi:hypothetical protein